MTKVIDRTDVVVVGGGAAGLMAAIAAAAAGAKTRLIAHGQGATALSTADLTLCGDQMIACGYQAAAEAPHALADEIQLAAFGLANPERVACYCGEAGDRLTDLLSWGLRRPLQFGRRSLLTPATELLAVLTKRATELGVVILSHGEVRCLCQSDSRVTGISLVDQHGGDRCIVAGATVLATGGYHHLVRFNTGGTAAPAFPHAWALRAGAQLRDLEFVSYCPFVPIAGDARGSIIPYQLSHVGACGLEDAQGHDILPGLPAGPAAFDNEWDKLVVAGASIEAVQDGRALANGTLMFRFIDPASLGQAIAPILTFLGASPGSRQLADRLLQGGPFPVGLAAHYSCGGVLVDCDGRSGVQGLLVCGEAAAGTFGAHRVASSLTDCLVFGWKAGTAAAQDCQHRGHLAGDDHVEPLAPAQPGVLNDIDALVSGALTLPRDGAALDRSRDMLRRLRKDHPLTGAGDALVLAEAVVASAITRRDSRGFHLRTDNATVDPTYHGNTTVTLSGGNVVVTLVPAPTAAERPIAHGDYIRTGSMR